MSRKDIELGDIDIALLKKQIKAVLDSNMPEDEKEGTHMLLGRIFDECIKENPGYVITSVCKADIIQAYEDIEAEDMDLVKRRVNELDENNMTYIAKKMADAYCECCFWSSLRDRFECYFYNDEWKNEEAKKEKFENNLDSNK